MIYDVAPDVGELTPAELRTLYEDQLRAVIDTEGVDTVVEESGVSRDTVEALTAGDETTLELEDAAAILAVSEAYPDAQSIVLEARDELLMGMSIAVLDVETLSSGIDDALEPKEIQAKLEGRFPMTLAEYALVHQFIEQRSP